MKILQMVCELTVMVLAVLELIFSIQLNTTVRVPMRMTLVPVAIIVLVIMIISFETAEISRNRKKRKQMEQKYEDQISELKKQLADANAPKPEVMQSQEEI